MLVINKSDIEQLLSPEQCVELMDSAMRRTSEGRVVLPLRQFMALPRRDGKLGLMPGYLDEPPCFGVKIVSKFSRPPGNPHGTHVGAVMLFDADSGLPCALLEGGTLTALRTAAASALATRTLARPDAHRLAIIGCGEQARRHIEALLQVRPINCIRIWGRSPERLEAFLDALVLPRGVSARAASSVAEAVGEADIVCTVTSAAEPVLQGAWLPRGVHLNLVGSAVPGTAEVDSDCVAHARYYVDYRAAALLQAGELLRAMETGRVSKDHIVGELGEVLLGRVPGRQSDSEITLYKSLGIAAQDLAAAHFVYRRALEEGLCDDVDLDG